MADSHLQIECIVSQPFSENTYILFWSGSTQCVVLDPGFDVGAIIQTIFDRKLTPSAILNTHGHSDHIAGNGAIKEQWPNCPLIIGRDDAEKLTNPELNLSAPFGFELISPEADQTVSEGDELKFAGLTFEVRETPGHSRGHVVFICRDVSPWIVLGGDVLFQGSIGRTDFPDGNHGALLRSIREKLFTLPADTQVFPGHGPKTTIGVEQRDNPFL